MPATTVRIAQDVLQLRLFIVGNFPVIRDVDELVLDLFEIGDSQIFEQLHRHAVYIERLRRNRHRSANRALVVAVVALELRRIIEVCHEDGLVDRHTLAQPKLGVLNRIFGHIQRLRGTSSTTELVVPLCGVHSGFVPDISSGFCSSSSHFLPASICYNVHIGTDKSFTSVTFQGKKISPSGRLIRLSATDRQKRSHSPDPK